VRNNDSFIRNGSSTCLRSIVPPLLLSSWPILATSSWMKNSPHPPNGLPVGLLSVRSMVSPPRLK